jgi:hypothetical protein
MANNYGFSTNAIRAGYNSADHFHSVTPPIYQTASFDLEDIDRTRRLWTGAEAGGIYSRVGTPTGGILEARIAELLPQIQQDMYDRAKKHLEEQTYKAADREEFEKTFAEKPGFVKAMWCGELACEEEIKEKFGVTSRCIPFEQEEIAQTCVCCGKPAKKMVYWGKSY